MDDLVALETALRQQNVAAFIFEPIQGKGVYFAKEGFLKEIHFHEGRTIQTLLLA